LLSVLFPVTQAFASEAERRPNGVTITVVVPGQEPETAAEPNPVPTPVSVPVVFMYPVDVRETRENGGRQIVKTYELSPLENPANIPRESFERNGWRYTLTDILRRETANAETRAHTETVTLDTSTNELAQILPLLSPTIEYQSEDEFFGFLSLDVSSIKVETAGTRTTSHTLTITREYPRLSNTDTSNVPKTVEDRGKTYTLAGVDWKVGNYSTVDYERIADYYTAVATYTATGYNTRVTGYITTAEYSGFLAKISQGKTIYTAYFEGEEIRTPLEMAEPPAPAPTAAPTPEPTLEPIAEPIEETASEQTEETVLEPTVEPTPEPTEEPENEPAVVPATETSGNKEPVLYAIIALLSLLLAGGAFYFIKNGKGKTNYEETTDFTSDDDDDDGDGGSGTGG
jgi:hypothetical protein